MSTLKQRRRRSRFTGAFALLAMAVAAAVPAQAVETTRYVALGDSYAAGQGSGPYLDGCYRSESSYAGLAAQAKTVRLVRNAACSGTTTQDVADTQLRQLNKSTGLVTITAGGNNLRVGDLFQYCGAALYNRAAAPPCEGAIAFAAAEIRSGKLAADTASLIQSVRAAAPNAKIVVTGYPYLYDPVTPDPADKLSLFIPHATALVDGLNRSIRTAAQGPGVKYVDVRAAFAGHGINSTEPWINLDLEAPACVGNFHPNAAGYQGYYAALQNAGAY